jgi:hypothetical protein
MDRDLPSQPQPAAPAQVLGKISRDGSKPKGFFRIDRDLQGFTWIYRYLKGFNLSVYK